MTLADLMLEQLRQSPKLSLQIGCQQYIDLRLQHQRRGRMKMRPANLKLHARTQVKWVYTSVWLFTFTHLTFHAICNHWMFKRLLQLLSVWERFSALHLFRKTSDDWDWEVCSNWNCVLSISTFIQIMVYIHTSQAISPFAGAIVPTKPSQCTVQLSFESSLVLTW